MKKFSLAVIPMLAILLLGEVKASAQFNNLHMSGYRVANVQPTSTRSFTGAVEIDCVNDDLAFTVSNICGTIYKDGKPFLRGDLSPVKVPHGSSKVLVDCHYAALADGVDMADVLKCMSSSPQDYTIDAAATVIDEKGLKKNVAKKNMKLASLMGKIGH